jgi:hypothetical protein
VPITVRLNVSRVKSNISSSRSLEARAVFNPTVTPVEYRGLPRPTEVRCWASFPISQTYPHLLRQPSGRRTDSEHTSKAALLNCCPTFSQSHTTEYVLPQRWRRGAPVSNRSARSSCSRVCNVKPLTRQAGLACRGLVTKTTFVTQTFFSDSSLFQIYLVWTRHCLFTSAFTLRCIYF